MPRDNNTKRNEVTEEFISFGILKTSSFITGTNFLIGITTVYSLSNSKRAILIRSNITIFITFSPFNWKTKENENFFSLFLFLFVDKKQRKQINSKIYMRVLATKQ